MDLVLPTPGSYVVAVSGGVDSMALLHLLYKESQDDRRWKLVVAHLDHGIREDSADDRLLVRMVADSYGLPFVFEEARLGAGASEATARTARYDFLHQVRLASEAAAVITAHHQDDVLETAVINMLRGSGRKGLTALRNRQDIVRPLLKISKDALIDYANSEGLRWHEDSTNTDETYLRNYVRHRLLSRFSQKNRAQLLAIIADLEATNNELDDLLINQLHQQPVANKIERAWFNQLPHKVTREVLATWLRENDIRNFDSKGLERLVVAAKTAAAGRVFPIQAGYNLKVQSDHLALAMLER